MPAFHPPSPGALIDGRYRAIDRIGEGNYGWVYRVEHCLLGQTFAMKVLHPRIADDPSWVARFREEAKSTSLTGHENIVFVTDFGHCDEYGYYFVMEHLVGRTLQEVLATQPRLEVERAMRLILSAASALSAAHDLGIVHRDLKPANLMLVRRSDGTETPKLLDFGISSLVLAAERGTKLYGTPAYMAPEQAVQPEVDHRADQFSLAVILYQALTGQMPWPTHGWPDARPDARRRTTPLPPSERVDDAALTPKLDQVIARALSVDFDQRWPSMDAFAEALVAAARVALVPRFDPLDFEHVGGEPTVARTAAAPDVDVASVQGAGESMVIFLDAEDLDAEQPAAIVPTITVQFRTASRLYREYKRNLVAGGLFVPQPADLALDAQIVVRMVVVPRRQSIELAGRVVSRSATGFGVAFDPGEQRRLTAFLRRLHLGLEISQGDTLRPVRDLDPNDALSAGEAFVLSRVSEPVPMAKIRLYATGLPFEVEDAVQSLIEKGYLEVDADDLASLSEVSSIHAGAVVEAPTEARDRGAARGGMLLDHHTELAEPSVAGGADLSEGSFAYTGAEVARVLATVEHFKARRNYFGAVQILEKALAVSPSVAQFYHELALLQAEFAGDLPRAMRAIHGAIQLDPGNPRYKRTLTYLERLDRLDR